MRAPTSRRRFISQALLTTSGIASVLALSACGGSGPVTVHTVNKVTTITINLAQLDAWAQATQNCTDLVLGLPGMSALVGTPTVLIIEGTTSIVAADIKKIDMQYNGTQTLKFDATSVPAAVQSLLDDCKKVADSWTTATNNKTIPAAATEYITALKTIVSLFQAQMSAVPTAATSATQMTNAQALAILHVKQ